MSKTQDVRLPLANTNICVLIDHKFIPDEISAYQAAFSVLGAEVDFVARIWYPGHHPEATTFYGDVDPLDNRPWESPQAIIVNKDISTVKTENYAAIISSANYTSVRARMPGPDPDEPTDLRQFVQSAPVVAWFAKAMENKKLVKGALCHGLWLLTPNPLLLEGRHVVCHPVVLADVLNCKASVVLRPKVVVDGDLVTGYSKNEVIPFIQAIAKQIMAFKEGAIHAGA